MQKLKTQESFILQTSDKPWTPDITDGSARLTKCSRPHSQTTPWLAPTQTVAADEAGTTAGAMTFGSLAEDWKAAIRFRVGVNTYAKYETNYRVHLKPHLAKLPAHLAAGFLQKLVNKKAAEVSPATVKQIVLVARHILALAVKRHLIAAIPHLRLPRLTDRIPPRLKPGQVSYLLQAAQSSKYGFGLWLELGTGMRRSEMLALEWSDFNENSRSISVTKAVIRAKGKYFVKETTAHHGTRNVALPDRVVDVLKNMRGKEGLMFATKNGSYLSPSNWQRLWKAWVARANKLIAKHNETADKKLALIGNVHFQDLGQLNALDLLH